MAEATLGVIGGSGLYEMEGLVQGREVRVETPFGMPSDDIVVGTLDKTTVAFLPRHGRGHKVGHPRPGGKNHPIGEAQRRTLPVHLTPDDYVTVYFPAYHHISIPAGCVGWFISDTMTSPYKIM